MMAEAKKEKGTAGLKRKSVPALKNRTVCCSR